MSEKQARRKRHLIHQGVEVVSKGRLWMQWNVPRKGLVDKKRHPGEGLGDFKMRRKISNERRRMRDRIAR